ncbi:MAG: EmrB/QacA family drug resistance transporter [Nitrospirae bacterium GWC2_57_9]|nr:MAG: EmrB/QacA family drug resistance transporter [Nitrospirae bacterium GWC2_57_9]
MSSPTLQHKTTSRALIAFTVMLPTLIEIIDTSIVNVSLNHIRGSLSAGLDESTWTITAYLVSNAIVIPMAGWLARLIGRKNYQIASIALFTFSSFMCGSAWSLESLVFFRVLQGLGGGGLVPISQSILLESFPREKHGTAMAIFGLGAMLGPIAGPLLGGWITDNWSWRWIFYINIPIGILSIIMNIIVIEAPPYMKRQKMKIDYWGLAFLAVGLGALQFVLDKGESEDWFGSDLILTFTVISVVSLALLLVNEYYSEHPIVNLKVFRDRTFTSGATVMFFVFLNLFGSIVLLPIFLQSMMGYTSYYAGLVLGPGGIATLLTMPLAGKLVNKVNPKRILTVGISICALSTYMMSRFTLTTDFWTFVWPRVALGLGMGLTFIPLTTMTLSHIPRENMTEATSLYNLLRNLGGSFGIAITTTILSRRAQLHQTRLAENLTPFDPAYQIYHDRIGSALAEKGVTASGADGVIYGELLRQANTLAFTDAFFTICLLILCVLPLVFIMQRPDAPASGRTAEH